MEPLYAHSARPERGIAAQPYADHIRNVVQHARANSRRMTLYHDGDQRAVLRAVTTAAALHDLGKLEDVKQAVLRSSSRAPLPGIPHEEAGIAHLLRAEDGWAAALIAAHHKGLFDNVERRERITSEERPPQFGDLDLAIRGHVDQHVDDWWRMHQADGCMCGSPLKSAPAKPVALRLALSCLVDADHSDTANHQWGTQDASRPRRRWNKRLQHLVAVAAEKPKVTERDRRRQAFFDACVERETDDRILSCMAPVGSGKTLGVMAHLLKTASARSLRHIFVVLPYTNIITQAVKEYRDALVLDDERGREDEIVAELHHQVDFDSMHSRQLAALWRAPIIVTTGVSFFETLAGSKPGRLRKLHELPGSAVFVDEAHAALPQHLWPLAWKWIETLCDHWGMHAVLGSGSLFRFWAQAGFLDPASRREVGELTPGDLLHELKVKEGERIRPRREILPLTVDDISQRLKGAEGPSVVVLNTVKSAATVATRLREYGFDTCHLSTALAPRDRAPIITEIKRRLADERDRCWVLVATSCIEAGLDFSFRRGYREAASVASLLQLGGRVRRNEEPWAGELVSFLATGDGITLHPMMKESSAILDGLLRDGEFERNDPDVLLSMAFDRALKGQFTKLRDELYELEGKRRHPLVQDRFKIIDTDTRVVAVHEPLIARLKAGDKVRFAEIVNGSVQVFGSRLNNLPCSELDGSRGIWLWTGEYDPDFLGYLADQKVIDELYAQGGKIV